jgi:hypothetical protein
MVMCGIDIQRVKIMSRQRIGQKQNLSNYDRYPSEATEGIWKYNYEVY